MDKILFNLAQIHLLTYCKNNNIDPSDSHTYRPPRRYVYYLVHNKDGHTIATVTFHKNSTPTYSHPKL